MPQSSSVVTILKRALDAVTEAGIPPELQALAFEKAVDLFAGGGRSVSAADRSDTADGAPGGSDSESSIGGSDSDTSPLAALASRLKVGTETISEVFDYDSDGLRIVLGTAKFESAKRAGTKQLALLVAAGRQGAGVEEWTPATVIREIARDYNRFDSSNFAYTITQMDDVFLFRGNSAQSREVKVNRQGYEQAAALVQRLTGGEKS